MSGIRSDRPLRSCHRLALLSYEEAQFVDLGPDYYADRTNSERSAGRHVRHFIAVC